jgi:hypothetical protein
MSEYPHYTYKKHTFFSALAMGISAFAITIVVSIVVLIVYGLHFVGNQSDKLVCLAEDAVRALPELHESLPPVLADVLDDSRQPDYREKLDIKAEAIYVPDRHGRMQTAIQVVNNGPEVISLLSLRVVILNENNEILAESNEWAATPIAAEDEWRGPLMPGSHRRFTASSYGRSFPLSSVNDLRTEVEVTDIRIWNSNKDKPTDTTVSKSDEFLLDI